MQRIAALLAALALAGCGTIGQWSDNAGTATGVPAASVPPAQQGPDGLLSNGLYPRQPYD